MLFLVASVMLVWVAVVTVFLTACVGAARADRAMLAASLSTVRDRRGLRLVSTLGAGLGGRRHGG